jgi:lipopolysaccharide/colanic/teichoic acid biosynthesis glycosyltransferase
MQGRPIFFKQERVGKDFRKFNIYKFRSLKTKRNNLFANSSDIKISKWGSFLRNTKIDEIPQLLNIVMGDMRFIGPRPEIPEYVVKEKFNFLKKLKPGLSGYSSIIFRNESEIMALIANENPYNDILKIKIALDEYYKNKKSFLEDLKLVIITLFSLVMPQKTGHYLLLKLLEVDQSRLDLKSILKGVKLKSQDLSLFKGSGEYMNADFKQ